MPLDELFEWYLYHSDQQEAVSKTGACAGQGGAVVARSVDEEIAMLKAVMGG